MGLESRLANAGLGNLVWSTIQLELNARAGDAGTRGHTASTKGLDLIYGELDRRENGYTRQTYDLGLGELFRKANKDLFENGNKGDPQTMSVAQLMALNSKERALILKLDERERDYVGGASVDKPLGSVVLKGMCGALSMAASNPDLKGFMGQMVDGYIQELDQREGLYLLKTTAPKQ